MRPFRLWILLGLVALLLPTRASAQIDPKQWSTEGIKLNPAANTVLCQWVNETGLADAHYLHFVVVATVNLAVTFEHMDAANTTALRAQIFPILASTPYDSMKVFLTVDVNERFRVRTNAIAVGNVQCSMFVE